MKHEFYFTYKRLKLNFEEALKNNYKIITCKDYIHWKQNKTNEYILVNRVDIDLKCEKAKIIADIFNSLNIKATFFIRLHASEYNPFSFENYLCLKYIKETGHEIAYHSEIIDQSVIWNETPEDCLRRDIRILNEMLGIKVVGVSSHGGLTGLNNLDFWKINKPSDFDLHYEAYDQEPAFNLFNESFYISESNYQWKCYKNGILKKNDKRSFSEHLKDNHPVIYSTMHTDTFFSEHIYES